MGWRDVVYGAYERRVLKDLPKEALPRHVAVMLDGNRRWARARGAGTASGHQAGADKIEELLEWCRDAGVEYVTLWLLSTDNLRRAEEELAPLLKIIETAVADLADVGPLAASRSSAPSTCCRRRPPRASAPRRSAPGTSTGMTVNVAVGYGGRREIADAVRDLLLDACRRRRVDRADRRRPHGRGHRRAPLHQGPARPRPRHPHVGRAAARRLPALAERDVGVLLLRGLLAGLPSRRLPARPEGVCRPAPSLRRLSRALAGAAGAVGSAPHCPGWPRLRRLRVGRDAGARTGRAHGTSTATTSGENDRWRSTRRVPTRWPCGRPPSASRATPASATPSRVRRAAPSTPSRASGAAPTSTT